MPLLKGLQPFKWIEPVSLQQYSFFIDLMSEHGSISSPLAAGLLIIYQGFGKKPSLFSSTEHSSLPSTRFCRKKPCTVCCVPKRLTTGYKLCQIVFVVQERVKSRGKYQLHCVSVLKTRCFHFSV